jgi:carbamoyl-phosphate synthase large subunit
MSVSSSVSDTGRTAREEVTAMVTAVGGASVGEQVLKALRLAGGYRVIGADMGAHHVNFDRVDEAYVLPPATDPNYVEAVLTVAQARGADVLFPGSEAELRVLSRHRDEVADAGVLLPIGPREVIETGMDKLATAAFLDDHGFAHPRFARVTPEEISEVDWFPVVVKPAVGGGGSVDCYMAQTPRELACLAELMGDRTGHLMVQEYVGTPEAEFTVGVLHDLDGGFVNSIAIRRELKSVLNVRMRVENRTGRDDLGPTLVLSSGFSHGSVERDEAVLSQCEAIAAALGTRGPLNIQCRVVDGIVQIFEINPRYSGTTSLRAMVGYNEPDLMIRRHLLGEELPVRFPYRTGRIHRRLVESFVSEVPAPAWTEAAAPLAEVTSA